MPNKVRVAMIGAGAMANSVHYPSLASFEDAEIAAICDVNQNIIDKAMKLVEEKQGKKPAYHQDFRKLIEDKSIDAVTIATSNHTHALLSIWAMQAGKHVYVEKPVSHNIWEGRKLVEASEAYARNHGCAHMDLHIVNVREELPAFYRRLGYRETGTEEFTPGIETRAFG